MTLLKALLATIGLFGGALLLVYIPVLWEKGWMVTLGIVLIMVFISAYCFFDTIK